jgi:hypothetical protein
MVLVVKSLFLDYLNTVVTRVTTVNSPRAVLPLPIHPPYRWTLSIAERCVLEGGPTLEGWGRGIKPLQDNQLQSIFMVIQLKRFP